MATKKKDPSEKKPVVKKEKPVTPPATRPAQIVGKPPKKFNSWHFD